MSTSIVVIASARDITVQPTRTAFPANTGVKALRWLPAGNGVEITNIVFDDPQAPINGLSKQPSGEWTATWDSNESKSGLWKYSVTVEIAGKTLPILDPEIENGPPIGMDDDDEDEPGGGG